MHESATHRLLGWTRLQSAVTAAMKLKNQPVCNVSLKDLYKMQVCDKSKINKGPSYVENANLTYKLEIPETLTFTVIAKGLTIPDLFADTQLCSTLLQHRALRAIDAAVEAWAAELAKFHTHAYRCISAAADDAVKLRKKPADVKKAIENYKSSIEKAFERTTEKLIETATAQLNQIPLKNLHEFKKFTIELELDKKKLEGIECNVSILEEGAAAAAKKA